MRHGEHFGKLLISSPKFTSGVIVAAVAKRNYRPTAGYCRPPQITQVAGVGSGRAPAALPLSERARVGG